MFMLLKQSYTSEHSMTGIFFSRANCMLTAAQNLTRIIEINGQKSDKLVASRPISSEPTLRPRHWGHRGHRGQD